MISLKDNIVFITGASSGIGKACARAFAELGAKLIMSARRIEKVETLAKELEDNFGTSTFCFQLDVREQTDVENAVKTLPEEWQKIDILVNNAGLARGLELFYKDDIQNWEEMIDTNIKGLLYVTRAIVPGMVERESGQVINIGSIAGKQVYPKGGVYCATKYAVDAISQSLRMDTVDKNIRVSNICPGAVETDFSNIRFHGDSDKAKNVYKGIEPLIAEDIADSVIYCATRPKHVNIDEIVVKCQQQASAFVTHRNDA